MELTAQQERQSAALDPQLKFVLVRYNTRQDNNNPLPWRLLVAHHQSPQLREEFFADEVHIQVPSSTTQSEIAEGIIKWHIAAEGYVHQLGDTFYITAKPQPNSF